MYVQVEELLGVSIPFSVVFEQPTIRLLAGHLLRLISAPQAGPIGAGRNGCMGTDSTKSSTLAELADAQPGSHLLLSSDAKAAGVACAPSQLYFVALQQVKPIMYGKGGL